MFTAISIYILFYVYSLYNLIFFFFYSNFPLSFIGWSMSNILGIISFYKKNLNVSLIIFLQICGLPPFSFFFFKFLLLSGIVDKLSYSTFILIFLITLLNVFFYLRAFHITNFVYSNKKLKETSLIMGVLSSVPASNSYLMSKTFTKFFLFSLVALIFYIDFIFLFSM